MDEKTNWTRRVISLSLCLSLTGCSFLFSEGPPPNHRSLPFFDCTTNYLAPAVDTASVVLYGLNAASAASTSDTQWAMDNPKVKRGAVVGVALVAAGIATVSAVYGYSNTRECKEARKEMNLRWAAHPYQLPGPATTAPTWPPPAPTPPPTPASPTLPAPAPTAPAPAPTTPH